MGSRRRGAALLMALAVLVIAVTASAILARASATARMHGRLDHGEDIALDLLASADRIILDWLDREAGSIVLPPDTAEPVAPVLHDVIRSGDLVVNVRINAWDQCGMAPLEMIRSGSPVRSALPPAVLDDVDRAEISADRPPGLDLLASPSPARHEDIAIFPSPPDAAAKLFNSNGDDTTSSAPDESAPSPAPPPVAEHVTGVGAIAATHNAAPAAINVNTAPRRVLEAVMRDLGLGGIEQIMAARADAKPARVAGIERRGEDRTAPAHLVDQSFAWAFRIDLVVGTFEQSWWAVYSNRDRDRSRENVWKCVQRIAITE